MYYVRIYKYGQISWKTMGLSNVLKLDRYKSNDGMCLPLEFESYDAAYNYTSKENKKSEKHNSKDVYYVEATDSPFVENWLNENRVFYKNEDGKIVNN